MCLKWGGNYIFFELSPHFKHVFMAHPENRVITTYAE